MSISESLESRLAALQALRKMLAADLDNCDSMRDKAALSRRFMDCVAQIEAIEKAEPEAKGTALDEFSRRRQAKQA